MSLRPEMKPWEKAAWCLIVGSLLFAEIQAIRKDRLDASAQALADRKGQDLRFKAVRDTQDADFKRTATSLTAAIDGIQLTLKTANKTLLQTQPHAAIKFESVEFSDGAPATIRANENYSFNYHYKNEGQETATGLLVLGKVYTGKPDDKAVQQGLAKEFEGAWLAEAHAAPTTELVPDYPSFRTIQRTLSPAEEQDVDQGGTVYFLFRFEWTDEAGRWRTDACTSFQRNSPSQIDVRVFHPCRAFQQFRYHVR